MVVSAYSKKGSSKELPFIFVQNIQQETAKYPAGEQLTGANAVPLALVTDMVNELVNGKVDAILVDGAVAKQYAETNKDLVIADASSELGAAQPYCVAVAKGDPKGLLPAINAAIAKMNEENKLESFISAADALKDVWQEVTPENPS